VTTLRALIDELIAAWRSADGQRAAMLFCEDGVYHEAGHEPIAGRERIAAHFARFFRDGPAWRFEADEFVVEGERAAVRYRFFLKGEGSGWRERAGCAVVHRRDGSIELWREYHG
jgi:nuclear transport factor 2 (NTF2) superfamily protein